MVASGSSDLKRRKSLAWCAFWKLEQLWKSPHISITTKVKLFNTTCVTILLYGCESWVISQDMENKINAFATSCYRVMLNIKRIDHVLNTTVYSMTNTVPLIHLVRHRQLKFLGHIRRMSKEKPARRYALYIPTIGKRRPGQMKEQCKNSRLPHLLMIVVHGETLWSPAPQPMDDDDDCLEMDSFPQNMILKSLFFLGLTHTPWNFWKMDIEVKIFRKEMSIIFCWNDCYKWESRQLFTPNQTNFEYLTLY